MNTYLRWVAVALALLIIGSAAILSGCSFITGGTPPAGTIQNVTPTQAYELTLQNQGNTRFVILDVRTPEEYAAGHIEGAVNLDFQSVKFKEEVNKLDKYRTYLVYCRTGVRSAAASKMMGETGIKNIYNMTGGITDWQARGYAVVK